MTPEKKVKDAIKKYLHTLDPPPYIFMPVQMGYGAATLDFLVCWRGRFFGIEAKRETGGVVSPRQKSIIREIAEAGGGVCVENSTGCENVRRMLGL